MGCDIHMFVETRRNSDAPWQMVGKAWHAWWKDDLIHAPYDDRNYFTFAILAGVRNGYEITPIAEPRGLPNDMSTGLREQLKASDVDDESPYIGEHGLSWLTLGELLAHDWAAVQELCGCVDEEHYRAFRSGYGPPQQYSGGVSGGPSRIVSNEELNAIIDGKAERSVHHYYTWIKWQEPHSEICDTFYDEAIPRLQSLGDPENVRIVFDFDS